LSAAACGGVDGSAGCSGSLAMSIDQTHSRAPFCQA
jgi:hypothetical protein